MENSSNTTTTSATVTSIPFHQLKSPSIDEYESGMEASISSMASGGDDDEDKQDEDFDQRNDYNQRQFKLNKSHRRMSSGSVSTDSTAPYSPKVLKKKPYFPLQKASLNPSVAMRIHSSISEVRTPNSGYDGDTEGQTNEDNITNH